MNIWDTSVYSNINDVMAPIITSGSYVTLLFLSSLYDVTMIKEKHTSLQVTAAHLSAGYQLLKNPDDNAQTILNYSVNRQNSFADFVERKG